MFILCLLYLKFAEISLSQGLGFNNEMFVVQILVFWGFGFFSFRFSFLGLVFRFLVQTLRQQD